MLSKMNIGVFDSGLGGLTILKEIIKKLPHYFYIYFGDSARVPYGNRTQEEIFQFTRQGIEFLFKKNCQLIIIACNTASTNALRKLQQEYLPKHYPNRGILGVIIPTVEEVIDQKIKTVGIIGTTATISSNSYVKEIRKRNKQIKIYQQETPLLVPLIEAGKINTQDFNKTLVKYLKPLINNNINGLILGCTHYELIKKQVQSAIENNIKIYSQGKIVANKLKEYLAKHKEINNKLDRQQKVELYFTDINEKYKQMIKIFYGSFDSLCSLRMIRL